MGLNLEQKQAVVAEIAKQVADAQAIAQRWPEARANLDLAAALAAATGQQYVDADILRLDAEVRLELALRGARCVAILVTHSHFDHLLGLADLAEETGAPVHTWPVPGG